MAKCPRASNCTVNREGLIPNETFALASQSGCKPDVQMSGRLENLPHDSGVPI